MPGSGGGRDFVLVHGIGASSRYFGPLAEVLARHGSVWLVDLPGYGSSPSVGGNPSIAEHAAVLGREIDAHGIVAPVVVGHSMGCQVVTALAHARPDVADELVLIAPTIDPAQRTAPRQAFRLLLDTLREPWRVNAVVFADYLLRCGPAYFVRQLRPMMDDRIEDRIAAITARTLVIVGDYDPVVPVAWAERVATTLPRGELAVVPGPHVAMFTTPREIGALILAHSAATTEVG